MNLKDCYKKKMTSAFFLVFLLGCVPQTTANKRTATQSQTASADQTADTQPDPSLRPLEKAMFLLTQAKNTNQRVLDTLSGRKDELGESGLALTNQSSSSDAKIDEVLATLAETTNNLYGNQNASAESALDDLAAFTSASEEQVRSAEQLTARSSVERRGVDENLSSAQVLVNDTLTGRANQQKQDAESIVESFDGDEQTATTDQDINALSAFFGEINSEEERLAAVSKEEAQDKIQELRNILSALENLKNSIAADVASGNQLIALISNSALTDQDNIDNLKDNFRDSVDQAVARLGELDLSRTITEMSKANTDLAEQITVLNDSTVKLRANIAALEAEIENINQSVVSEVVTEISKLKTALDLLTELSSPENTLLSDSLKQDLAGVGEDLQVTIDNLEAANAEILQSVANQTKSIEIQSQIISKQEAAVGRIASIKDEMNEHLQSVAAAQTSMDNLRDDLTQIQTSMATVMADADVLFAALARAQESLSQHLAFLSSFSGSLDELLDSARALLESLQYRDPPVRIVASQGENPETTASVEVAGNGFPRLVYARQFLEFERLGTLTGNLSDEQRQYYASVYRAEKPQVSPESSYSYDYAYQYAFRYNNCHDGSESRLIPFVMRHEATSSEATTNVNITEVSRQVTYDLIAESPKDPGPRPSDLKLPDTTPIPAATTVPSAQCDSAARQRAPFAAGSGSEEDPYLICTSDQLNAFRMIERPTGLRVELHAELGDHIDFQGQTLQKDPYTTQKTSRKNTLMVLAGNGYEIRNWITELTLSQELSLAAGRYPVGLGLFSHNLSARDLGIRRAQIRINYAAESWNSINLKVGVLCGECQELQNVYVSESTIDADFPEHKQTYAVIGMVGGELATYDGNSKSHNVAADRGHIHIFSPHLNGVYRLGGLIGRAGSVHASLSDSWSTAEIISSSPSLYYRGHWIGGITGLIAGSITNSVFAGRILTDRAETVGGIVANAGHYPEFYRATVQYSEFQGEIYALQNANEYIGGLAGQAVNTDFMRNKVKGKIVAASAHYLKCEEKLDLSSMRGIPEIDCTQNSSAQGGNYALHLGGLVGRYDHSRDSASSLTVNFVEHNHVDSDIRSFSDPKAVGALFGYLFTRPRNYMHYSAIDRLRIKGNIAVTGPKVANTDTDYLIGTFNPASNLACFKDTDMIDLFSHVLGGSQIQNASETKMYAKRH